MPLAVFILAERKKNSYMLLAIQKEQEEIDNWPIYLVYQASQLV